MIDYSRSGLRLGYLIRGRYHDENGTARVLRLAGPSTRVGSGYVAPDPDDGAAVPSRKYWRSGVFAVSLLDDIGKLTQTIQTPGSLSLVVPMRYPAAPSLDVRATDDDVELRRHAESGRWRSKAVDVWLVDIDTGATEHRFVGQWDRDPSVSPGAFKIDAKARPGPLQRPWRMTELPNAEVVQGIGVATYGDYWTETNVLSSSGLVNNTPDEYGLAPSYRGARVGCVFGYNDASGLTNGTFAPCIREIIWYGHSTGSDRAIWFHVSPQFGCGVGNLRFVGDDGTIYSPGVGGVATSWRMGHNYIPTRGPLGTFLKITVDAAVQANFNPDENDNRAYARIHGPGADPTTVEWNTSYGDGEPFTTLNSPAAMSPAIEHAADILDEIFTKPEFLNEPNLLGTGATAAFKASPPPGAVAEFGEFLSAVPQAVNDATPPTYRDVLSALMFSLPADLVYRLDPAVGERRLFPIYRKPQSATAAPTFDLRPSDYVSSQPVSVSQSIDPRNEYANEVTVQGQEFLDPPSGIPLASSDLLTTKRRRTQQARNAAEQGPTRLGAVVQATRKWEYWTSHSFNTGEQQSLYHAGEASQRQVWTVARLGPVGFQMQIGDTLRHNVHGITTRVGMIRRIQYSLDEQTAEVHACHLVFYDTDEVGGDDLESGED